LYYRCICGQEELIKFWQSTASGSGFGIFEHCV